MQLPKGVCTATIVFLCHLSSESSSKQFRCHTILYPQHASRWLSEEKLNTRCWTWEIEFWGGSRWSGIDSLMASARLFGHLSDGPIDSLCLVFVSNIYCMRWPEKRVWCLFVHLWDAKLKVFHSMHFIHSEKTLFSFAVAYTPNHNCRIFFIQPKPKYFIDENFMHNSSWNKIKAGMSWCHSAWRAYTIVPMCVATWNYGVYKPQC